MSVTVIAPERATTKSARCKRVGDVVDKRHHLSREPDFAVSTPHQLLIRLPGLVDNVPIYNTFSADFESPYDTNIQAMGSGRTA